MSFAPLSAAVFAELARTRSAPADAALLRSALHARRLLLLKALLVHVHRHRDAVDPAVFQRFEASWHLLERAERRNPAVVRDLLDYPMTGAWVAAALAEPLGPALDRHLGRLDSLAVTAALRAGCPLDIAIEAPDGLLSLPGVGRQEVGTGHARITAASRVARIHPEGVTGAAPTVLLLTDRRTGALVGDGPGWLGLPVLPGAAARLDALDPYRVPPGGVGTPARTAAEQTDSDPEAWSAQWCAAQALLTRTDPGRAAEVRRALRALVPLAPLGTRSFGATLRSAPGAVLTSPPAGAQDMAETLVHEIHHSKLATLHELVPLYRQGRSVLHRVGWRPDARPIGGVLQGAYAHLALTDLWRRAATAQAVPRPWRSSAGQQFDHMHDQVGEALAILLESDELTNEGREFAQQMRRHHASLGAAPRAAG
ncbi:HEXXH motif domain-containing protein [Streptomyces sp. Je 1-79]|uniref:HEXXH motif domain-containing protein n=1 Tax=Streptomyces sp. Je 1-79 TaxID=2943847 RepID=UPI0021A5071E|nr:HEXXH motif domain-containing protein [Streptomyces sp. Je 1-79]MCT4354465.1 HEXXH motif domain-containing protein [Streptomyces sp. Je 1-79]